MSHERARLKNTLRWLLPVVLVLMAAWFLFLRPAPAPGQVLYLHLRLAPYAGGSVKDIQYWIDAANGRVRYVEAMPNSGALTSVASRTAAVSRSRVFVSLQSQPFGRCGVTDTDLLDGFERFDNFPCAGLLALRDTRGLQARARDYLRQYGAHARTTGRSIIIPLPAGADFLPLIVDRHNMAYGYESYAPGVLVLDRSSGWPRSVSGDRRDGVTMTTTILEARSPTGNSARRLLRAAAFLPGQADALPLAPGPRPAFLSMAPGAVHGAVKQACDGRPRQLPDKPV